MGNRHQADRTCDIFVLNSGYGGFVPANLFPATRGIKVVHESLSVPAVHKRRLTIKAPVSVFEWHDGG